MGFEIPKNKGIQCAVCKTKIKDEAGILEHVKSTGHTKIDIDI